MRKEIREHRVHIFNDVTIGAGSTVIKNLAPGGVYVGNPARRVLRPIIDTEETLQ